MQTVYKFDPKTRRPIDSHECRVDTRTGEAMRPRYSIDTPPPEYPDFVEVLAGEGVWWVDIERSRMNALESVDSTHAHTLRILTGNATIEERDTWTPKAQAARALLAGAASDVQSNMLAGEAVGRGLSAEGMAELILTRSSEFEVFIGVLGAIRSKARTALSNAETIEEMKAADQAHSDAIFAAVAG